MAVPSSFPAKMAQLAPGQPEIEVFDLNGYIAAVKLGSSYSLATPTVTTVSSTTKIVAQALNREQTDGRPASGHGSN